MYEIRDSITIPLNGRKIFAIYHKPLVKKRDWTVLFLHGFGGNKVGKNALFVEMSTLLAKNGIASLRFDFRGSGDSEGAFEEQTLTSLLQDAETVYNWLEGSPVVVLGPSMGGLIASLLAASKKIEALVLWAPVFDAHQWIDEWQYVPQDHALIMHKDRLVSRQFFEEFFCIEGEAVKKAINKLPLFCVRADKDETLDALHTEKYKQAVPQGTYITLEEADHSFSRHIDRLLLQQKTLEWLVAL